MQFLIQPILSVLKFYVMKAASEEFVKWCFMQLAEAAVKSTKTTHDDEFLAKFKEVVEKG